MSLSRFGRSLVQRTIAESKIAKTAFPFKPDGEGRIKDAALVITLTGFDQRPLVSVWQSLKVTKNKRIVSIHPMQCAEKIMLRAHKVTFSCQGLKAVTIKHPETKPLMRCTQMHFAIWPTLHFLLFGSCKTTFTVSAAVHFVHDMMQLYRFVSLVIVI